MKTNVSYPNVGFGGQSASPYQNQALQALLSQLSGTQGFGQEGENMLQKRALAGSIDLPAAEQNVQNTLQGKYLYGGAGFNAAEKAAEDRARNVAIPGFESAFERTGGGNSALAQQGASNIMGQAIGDAFAQNYNQERNRQMQAAGLSPELARADYLDANELMGAQSGAAQNVLNAINQGKVNPQYSNPGMGILGGILGGAGTLFSGGQNSAASGIEGLLSNLFRGSSSGNEDLSFLSKLPGLASLAGFL